jgi:hypothetical protein
MSTCQDLSDKGGCSQGLMLDTHTTRQAGMVVEEHPLMKFGGATEADSFYLQHGKFWSVQGQELTPGSGPVPSLESFYAQYNPAALMACGLAVPAPKVEEEEDKPRGRQKT